MNVRAQFVELCADRRTLLVARALDAPRTTRVNIGDFAHLRLRIRLQAFEILRARFRPKALLELPYRDDRELHPRSFP